MSGRTVREEDMMQQDDVIAYRVEDAVRVSGCARSRLYEAMRDGDLPFRKVGRRTLILRNDLIVWLDRATSVEPKRQPAA